MDLPKRKLESWAFYLKLFQSLSIDGRCLTHNKRSIKECLNNTLAVLFTDEFSITTGSQGEGTDILKHDYDKHTHPTPYFSDKDVMNVLYYVQVIDEGDTLPQRFDNNIYCQAERGKHTTAGFRKLRIIHRPEQYLVKQYIACIWASNIDKLIEHGYISSSKFVATALSTTDYLTLSTQSITTGVGTKGPSQIVERNGAYEDFVRCFYVKSWPKEAEEWSTRETYWPDRKLKSKIKETGYLLVPIGNSNSQESDLEWRCSFSMAEKILFQSMTEFQRCTFIILKALLKEYLPSDINKDGEKQLLSTYHIKTLFMWCLEDSKLMWEPENMVDIIDHLLDELSGWIKKQNFPHYFIRSVNLLDIRRLHGMESSLICFISFIRNDLSYKIRQSQLFKDEQTIIIVSESVLDNSERWLFYLCLHNYVMKTITGRLQMIMYSTVYKQMLSLKQLNFSHAMLLEGLISIEPDIDPQLKHLYRAIYTDPIHDKLLTEVMPGLIFQYRGCIHLAKYCMAARDDRILPYELHIAEHLLKGTMHLEPCSGNVKLAFLYLASGDFVQAVDILDVAENMFQYIYNRMKMSVMPGSRIQGIEIDRISTKVYAAITHEVLEKWVEGQVTSNIVMTWPEYITLPGVLQFELIHESTQQVTDAPYKCKGEKGKMIRFDCRFQMPPLSMIKLLKFICAFNSGRSSTCHINKLAADLIASALYVNMLPPFENDIYIVFNMAAWCYVKIKEYKSAARMMTVAIGTSSQIKVMNRCAFSYHFTTHVLAQCLDSRGRVLV